MWWHSSYRAEKMWQRLKYLGPQNLKHILCGPFQKMFADPWYKYVILKLCSTFPLWDWQKQLYGLLYNLGVWLVISCHINSPPKATRQKTDNYTIVIDVGNSGNNHVEFPEDHQRSYWKHTLIRSLWTLTGEEISIHQWVEQVLQCCLSQQRTSTGITLEPRTEVAILPFSVPLGANLDSWTLSLALSSWF